MLNSDFFLLSWCVDACDSAVLGRIFFVWFWGLGFRLFVTDDEVLF